ncbi:MAG: hypothetical protein N3D16_11870, partial [Anaerolineales bacterium]|nr:hypothetical protein [Anaerolineales bacterium]
MKYRILSFLIFPFIFAGFLTITGLPAQKVLAQDQPTPTNKYCHLCDQMTAQAVVRVILFWMDGCPHCHE